MFRARGGDDGNDDTSRIGSRLIPGSFQTSHMQGHSAPQSRLAVISSLAPRSISLCNIRVCANVIHDAITNHFEEAISIVPNNGRIRGFRLSHKILRTDILNVTTFGIIRHYFELKIIIINVRHLIIVLLIITKSINYYYIRYNTTRNLFH